MVEIEIPYLETLFPWKFTFSIEMVKKNEIPYDWSSMFPWNFSFPIKISIPFRKLAYIYKLCI